MYCTKLFKFVKYYYDHYEYMKEFKFFYQTYICAALKYVLSQSKNCKQWCFPRTLWSCVFVYVLCKNKETEIKCVIIISKT